jgi:hypothetical protein
MTRKPEVRHCPYSTLEAPANSCECRISQPTLSMMYHEILDSCVPYKEPWGAIPSEQPGTAAWRSLWHPKNSQTSGRFLPTPLYSATSLGQLILLLEHQHSQLTLLPLSLSSPSGLLDPHHRRIPSPQTILARRSYSPWRTMPR